jgi:hypothetical protein
MCWNKTVRENCTNVLVSVAGRLGYDVLALGEV